MRSHNGLNIRVCGKEAVTDTATTLLSCPSRLLCSASLSQNPGALVVSCWPQAQMLLFAGFSTVPALSIICPRFIMFHADASF